MQARRKRRSRIKPAAGAVSSAKAALSAEHFPRLRQCHDALVYKYGTHYAFPESMLKGIIPVFPDFLIGRAFLSAREHPDECKATREDIDRRMKQALSVWTREAVK